MPGMLPLDYEKPERRNRWTSCAVANLTCGAGLIGNAIVAFATWKVFGQLPPGTVIDPMMFTAFVLLIVFGTAVTGVPLGIVGIIGGRHRASHWMLAVLGIFLSLMPLITHCVILQLIVSRHGLVYSSH
jgi:hypothetical protein